MDRIIQKMTKNPLEYLTRERESDSVVESAIIVRESCSAHSLLKNWFPVLSERMGLRNTSAVHCPYGMGEARGRKREQYFDRLDWVSTWSLWFRSGEEFPLPGDLGKQSQSWRQGTHGRGGQHNGFHTQVIQPLARRHLRVGGLFFYYFHTSV